MEVIPTSARSAASRSLARVRGLAVSPAPRMGMRVCLDCRRDPETRYPEGILPRRTRQLCQGKRRKPPDGMPGKRRKGRARGRQSQKDGRVQGSRGFPLQQGRTPSRGPAVLDMARAMDVSQAPATAAPSSDLSILLPGKQKAPPAAGGSTGGGWALKAGVVRVVTRGPNLTPRPEGLSLPTRLLKAGTAMGASSPLRCFPS